MPQAATARNGVGTIRPNGAKIHEAAGYLKSARVCLLTWARDTHVSTDNVGENVEEISEMFAVAQRLEEIRAKLDVRASILGR